MDTPIVAYVEHVPLLDVGVGEPGLGRGERHDVRRIPLHHPDHQLLVAAPSAAGRLDADLRMVLLEAVDGLPVQLVPGAGPGARPQAGHFHHLSVRQVGIAAGGEDARTGSGALEEAPAVHGFLIL